MLGELETGPDLAADLLHGSLGDPSLTSMNFLNEITGRYPDAVSFAPGRPYEGFFDRASLHDDIEAFHEYLRTGTGASEAEADRALFQYGRTKGIVHGLIAAQLRADEGIDVDPESIVVTVGCQEAMFLTLRALRADERDVVLSLSPMYVGFTGAARLLDLPVLPVSGGTTGVDLDDLRETVRRARAAGRRPRACYMMPDFANPSGLSLDLPTRRALLELAEGENILLLEDNPYGMFHDGYGRLPTLKALDTARRVVYLGSFAKTVLPGARVGYVVADQRVRAADGTGSLFADELAKIKSMVSVNTSPVAQAVIGGALVRGGGSLAARNEPLRARYQRNLARVLAGLQRHLGDRTDVTWNAPTGGFFVVVEVGFPVTNEALERSAREFGVLWTPMAYFYVGDGGRRHLRLSFSLLTDEQIDEGLSRLAAFLAAEDDRTA
ncbi:2-aminoadipate aminotransferase [Actinocatenispora thailandica]|uniref:2-aminoadipate aminotransferase n=1 Tax=Actinocatenispora thailandica TaxID=227318 RepID=A0A7R7DLG1_9ACTN|nr:PLP-dependent aminotransferase family protein [Actinocatenispora thailandica]BCJ33899.1 2-aminoadipate aminotransferase [Actinocatenispora thailandica]